MRQKRQGDAARRLGADERGNVAILFAVLLSLGTVLGALAVDEGALYLQRRQVQSAVDLAALAAAPDPGAGFARARQMLVDAGLVDANLGDSALAHGTTGVGLGVEAGTYTPDPSRDPAARFVAGGSSPNAVRVAVHVPGTLYFAQSWARARTPRGSGHRRGHPVGDVLRRFDPGDPR